jgi:hypothetical protein
MFSASLVPFDEAEDVLSASLDSQFNINLLHFATIFKFFNINMFASLRNKFSNYRTCFLRFDIKKNINIAFDSLRFNTLAITAPHYSISSGAFAVSE